MKIGRWWSPVLHGRRRSSIRVYGIPISSIALPSVPNLFKGSKLLYHRGLCYVSPSPSPAMSRHRRRLLCLTIAIAIAIAIACYLSPLPALSGLRGLCVAVSGSVFPLPVERERGIAVKAQGLEYLIPISICGII
ncbi:hypothetical protein LXL04_021178 [Taraxacum kok-saghyz]